MAHLLLTPARHTGDSIPPMQALSSDRLGVSGAAQFGHGRNGLHSGEDGSGVLCGLLRCALLPLLEGL